MAHHDEEWLSYFYPETVDPETKTGTLVNLLGERDPAVLKDREQGRVAARQSELAVEPALVERTFDAAHLQAIHRHLFQDVYEWAGRYRTVGIAKGKNPDDQKPMAFADVGNGDLERYLEDVRRGVADTAWSTLSEEEFAQKGAEVFAALNEAHPFREGNGRTTKIFMAQVAELSPYKFDFAGVPPEIWNFASQLSRPQERHRYDVNPAPMAMVFAAISSPRPPTADAIPPENPSTPEVSEVAKGTASLEDLARRAAQLNQDLKSPGAARGDLIVRLAQIDPPAAPIVEGPQA